MKRATMERVRPCGVLSRESFQGILRASIDRGESTPLFFPQNQRGKGSKERIK